MDQYFNLIFPSFIETVIMVGISSILSIVFGLVIGVILVATRKGGVKENWGVYTILSKIMDAIRSIPFIILMFFMIPVTRFVVGTSITLRAAILPLLVSATPFFARLTETSLLEVPPGIVEAAQSMGSSSFQILKVMVWESKPSLVRACTNLVINLIGYSAIAGVSGSGGLGDLAIRYGFHRYRFDVMLITVIVLYILVTIIQFIGTKIANSLERK